MNPDTRRAAAKAAKAAHRSPYQVNDRAAKVVRIWFSIALGFEAYVATRLIFDLPVARLTVWIFVALLALRILAFTFAPLSSRALKRKNAMAREQIHQVRRYFGGDDGGPVDLVAMGLGNLFDADPTLDQRSTEAAAVFIAVSVQQLLTDVEAQVADSADTRRPADRSVRTGVR